MKKTVHLVRVRLDAILSRLELNCWSILTHKAKEYEAWPPFLPWDGEHDGWGLRVRFREQSTDPVIAVKITAYW